MIKLQTSCPFIVPGAIPGHTFHCHHVSTVLWGFLGLLLLSWP